MTDSIPSPGSPWLVGDIGGTYARFGLVTDLRRAPHDVRILPTTDFSSLHAAVRSYLAHGAGHHPVMACLAVAGPSSGTRWTLTNVGWEFTDDQLREALNLRHLSVINDFSALAMAVPGIPAHEYQRVGTGRRVAGEPVAIIGPGTGLGVASLIRHGRSWLPIPGEGGHATLPVDTDDEAEIARILRRDHPAVCAETVLSGPGIARLHRAVAIAHGTRPSADLSPRDICEAARRGSESTAMTTLSMFCGFLGAFAGNVALTVGARGGVVLGGGVLPTITDILQASRFRARFCAARAVAGYLDDIATDVLLTATPALSGAAAWLRQYNESVIA